MRLSFVCILFALVSISPAQIKNFHISSDSIFVLEDIGVFEGKEFSDIEPQFCWVVSASKNSADTLMCIARYLTHYGKGVVIFDLKPVINDFRQYLEMRDEQRKIMIMHKNKIMPPVQFPKAWFKQYDFYLQVVRYD